MKEYRLETTVEIPHPRDTVFEFFSNAANLERLTPEFLHFRILTPQPIPMKPGALIDYTLRVHGLPVRWRTKIETWEPPFRFTDTQIRGPYALWHHTHSFRETPRGTEMTDVVRYALPFGPLGALAHALMVRRDVEGIFEYRTRRIREIFPG